MTGRAAPKRHISPSAELPRRVRVVEVGPRDGLQNQPDIIPTEVKAEWIRRLMAAGLEEIEATSFVHPKWVPQLADARDLFRLLPSGTDCRFSALVPNSRGLDDAIAAGVERIAVFTAASETFSLKNINCGIEESLDRFRGIFDALGESPRVSVRGYLSTCFGCPYEGRIPETRVLELSLRLLDLGCDEVAISDTVGVATAGDVNRVLDTLLPEIPAEKIALHFHDTRGQGLANVLTGLQRGVGTFDASAGGLGGCPYAPGASGNLATEDLIYLLDGLGVESGVDLDALIAADLWFQTQCSSPLPSRVLASRATE